MFFNILVIDPFGFCNIGFEYDIHIQPSCQVFPPNTKFESKKVKNK